MSVRSSAARMSLLVRKSGCGRVSINKHHFSITLSKTEGQPLVIPSSPPEHADYLVGQFITSLAENDNGLLSDVDTLAKATMLANALYLPEPASAGRKFKHTSVYFDTPFILFALGYGGSVRKVPRAQLLRLLYEANADLYIFEHTLQESRSALLACVEVLELGRSRGYGPSMEFFLREGISGSDVRLFAQRLENDLESLRIAVAPKPDYDPKYQVDEQGLASALRSGVGYREDRPLRRDVDSVSAIMRLRQGLRPRVVEDSKAIFVTTNQRLVRAANEHLRSDENVGVVAPCISDYTMTSILWLKYPLVAPDLPRQRLLADSFAATQPSDGLWRKYADEILRLESHGKYSAEDVYLLRHSLEARHALMDATSGETASFTEGTISEILEKAKEGIQSEALDKFEKERAKADERQQELAAVSSELAEARETEVTRRSKMRERARRQSRALIIVIRVLAIGLLAVGTAYTFPWELPKFKHSPVEYGLSILLLCLFLLVVTNLVTGASLNSWLRSLETKIEDRLYSRLEKMTGG